MNIDTIDDIHIFLYLYIIVYMGYGIYSMIVDEVDDS